MIYIKENGQYFRYHLTDDGKLVCTGQGNEEYVILHDISDQFDGIITPDKKVHFVLQSLNGEILYLKKENDTWKKFSILKSRRGLQKISDIRIAASETGLCAFYIMNHQGKSLLVKHVFSLDNLFTEPEVLGVTDGRCKFVMLWNYGFQTSVIYKDSDGDCHKITFDKNFKTADNTELKFESGLLNMSAIAFGKETLFTYTVPRKNSVALMFCSDKNPSDVKIVTFGIARNTLPHILMINDTILIQWEENGMIMQSESFDFGRIFSKPKHLSTECRFAKVRQIQNDIGLSCNKCAVYNMAPFLTEKSWNGNSRRKEASDTMNNFRFINKEINGEITNEQIMKKMTEIKNDIDRMEKSMADICSFLEDIKNFKNDTENTKQFPTDKTITENLSGEDIGEINKDNVELFENTNIDDVLPDKAEV